MNKLMLKLAIVATALFAAAPLAAAQSERSRGAGPIVQNLRQVDQQAFTEAANEGLIALQVVASNVNVQALNNISVIVDLTNVLRDADIITDNVVVVGVSVLSPTLLDPELFLVRIVELLQ